MTAKRVYLIRHGQTDWNASGRWQGTLPVPLNIIGYQQAAELAAHYKDTPISAVYASDLPRAFETAQALADARGLSVVSDARLREVDLGALQGLTREDIMVQHPQDWAEMHANFFDWMPPGGGETRRQVQKRMVAAFNAITAQHPDQEIALVSHGLAIRMLLIGLFASEIDAMRRLDIHNTSVTVVEPNGDGSWRGVRWVDIRHLTPLEVDAEHDKGESKE